MDTYYQRAIDILTTDSDWRSICIAMAKANPKEFCEAVDMQGWRLETIRVFNSEGKIPAIKYIRTQKQMTLKEAKQAVEDLVADKEGEAEQ